MYFSSIKLFGTKLSTGKYLRCVEMKLLLKCVAYNNRYLNNPYILLLLAT